MISQVKNDLEFLTATIVDAHNKPHLRSVVGYQLLQMGHDREEVETQLREFFDKGTVH